MTMTNERKVFWLSAALTLLLFAWIVSITLLVAGKHAAGSSNLELRFTNIGTTIANVHMHLPRPAVTSPSSLVFGSVPMGQSASLALTLTNAGPGAILFGAISVTGANASDFTFTNGCPAPLPMNNSCNLIVLFTPTGLGARVANLNVPFSAVLSTPANLNVEVAEVVHIP
jgi:hypothetical protein